MAAVRLRLRAELRTRWRAWLALAALSGLLAGVVIATVAGARRTDSAVARHRIATGAADVWVARSDFFGLELDFSRVERLPQVLQAARSRDLAFWARTESGRPVTHADVELGVSTQGRDGAQNRPMVLAGRPPDPAAADEIFVGHRAADRYDLGVGSTLRVRFATPRELERLGETGEHDARADPETAGTGPLLTLRVVGIRADVQSEDGYMYITMSPAFQEAYGHRVGTWVELTGIWLERSDADLAAFRAGVERIAAGKPVELYPKRTLQAKLESSIDFQVKALWVVAALGGLAALLLLGQAVARQIALDSAQHPLLRSLGMTRGQLFALAVARVVPVSLVAAGVAAGVAVALSPLAPIGAARVAEPSPGLAVDPLAVGAGAAATAVLVLLAALGPAWRASRPRETRERPRASVAVGLLARAGLPPSGVAGVRMALEPGRSPTAVPVRSTLVAVAVGVAAVAAALTITASADRLLRTPGLYGHNWDALIGDGNVPRYSDRFIARLRADRAIGELSGGTVRELRLGGRQTGVLAIDPIRGGLAPTVLEGRPPAAPDEVLLGSRTAAAVDAGVGDAIEGRLAGRAQRYRVVGLGVLPEVGFTGLAPVSLGDGAVTTFAGVRRLDPAAAQNLFLLRLAPGADRRATLARLERDAAAMAPTRPADVGNWGGVRVFPYALAALIGTAGAAVLAHALAASVRRRRRDLAILRTLGFERRQVGAVVVWQATTVAAVGLLVGLPAGVAIGRFAWNLLATELGVAPDPVAPVSAALLIVPATILLANLVALPLGRIAARTRPAVVLRAE